MPRASIPLLAVFTSLFISSAHIFSLYLSYFLGFHTLISFLSQLTYLSSYIVFAFQAARHPDLYQALTYSQGPVTHPPQTPHLIIVSLAQLSVNPRTNCSITLNPVKVYLSLELEEIKAALKFSSHRGIQIYFCFILPSNHNTQKRKTTAYMSAGGWELCLSQSLNIELV